MGRSEIFSSQDRESHEQESSNVVLYAGNSNRKLSKAVAKLIGTSAIFPADHFADKESHIQLPKTIGPGKFVFVLQSTRPPKTEKYLMEVRLMLDAIKRSTGSYIPFVTAIIPYFGYGRQEKKDGPRVPIAASVVAKDIQNAGAKRIMAIDVHNDILAGFVEIPFDLLYASYVLVPALLKEGVKGSNLCVMSTDMGGLKRAKFYQEKLAGGAFSGVYKERSLDIENHTHAVCLLRDDNLPQGFLQGMDVLIVDDMIDTGGSVLDAITIAREKGARNVYVAATHGVFSKPGKKRMIKALNNEEITKLFITDTLPVKKRLKRHPSVHVISIAPLIAEAINYTVEGKSLGDELIL